jgi:hypothetical protein
MLQFQDGTFSGEEAIIHRPSAGNLLRGCLLMLLVLIGSAMQAYANRTTDAFLVASLFLVTGCATVGLLFPGARPEWRAFLWTYVVCIFVGGLAQCYSMVTFGNPQSTIDAPTFLRHIAPEPPFTTMADMPPFNSPLAVLIWQQVYKVAWWLGLDFGSYTAVMFNALVMGLTAGITVRTAREFFGDDDWRLQRVGTLFASCGLFILFGAVLLRDCFTTFFNALVLWALVRWLCRSTLRNLVIAVGVTGVSAYAMIYLRFESVLMFGLFWFLGFLFWFWRDRLNPTRLAAVLLVCCVGMIGGSYLRSYVQMSQKSQARTMTSYLRMAAKASQDDSLGMRLVVKQPLPIRLVLGSGSLMVYPIPLWAFLEKGVNDYHLVRTYHGVYQILVLPLVFAGFIAVFRLFQRDRKQAVPLAFLAVYLLMDLAAVVATSLEQRHVAQFMPAFMILAAVPDTRDEGTRLSVRYMAIAWFCTVILVHLAWAMAK